MQPIKTKLLEFVKQHIKNRDLILKRIKAIKDNKHGFLVKYKDKETQFSCIPALNEIIFNEIENSNIIIITLNTEKNISFLIKNWTDFSKHKKLCLYFSNPFSKNDRFWLIYPFVHEKIADVNSLKRGLETLSGNVEKTEIEEFRKITT